MSLLTLPPELLVIIIRKLDTKSVYNLYEAGIMCMQGLVKECYFSMNTLATSKSLRSNFFAGVSGCLTVLNLSGVPDLDLPSLIGALSDMKNLKDLDVSYTNITITDFLQIAKTRPTLKSIGINFSFGKIVGKSLRRFEIDHVLTEVNEEVVLAYQQAFEGFENVHFVGRINGKVNGSLAVRVLEKADLFNLKFTSKGYTEHTHWSNKEYVTHLTQDLWNKMKMPKMSQFQLYSIKTLQRESIFNPPIYNLMDFNKYEVLVIGVYYPSYDLSAKPMQKVIATPLLKKLICDNFDVDVTSLPEIPSLSEIKRSLPGFSGVDTVLMFWDRERTNFDSKFSAKFIRIFNEHYIFNVDISTLTLIPAAYEWCSFEPSTSPDSEQTSLDYGFAFNAKENIKLKLRFDKNFQASTMPNIISNFDFLKKITHLTLSGKVYYDSMFFKHLFEHCDLLVTLQIALCFRIFDVTFLQFVKSSKSLKNILLFARGIEVSSQLFSYLSECRTLENIYMYLYQPTVEIVDTLPNPTELFRKCTNLYNLCINTKMQSREVADEIFGFYRNVAKNVGRDAIYISYASSHRPNSYHPYLSVFNHVYQLNPACSKI